MTNIKIAAVLAAMLALSACSTTDRMLDTIAQDQAIYDEYIAECTFKNGKTPAPKWVCGYPIDDYTVTETGYSHSGSESEAKARALVKLAGRIQTLVKSEAKLTENGDSRRHTQAFEETSRQVIDERLSNTRVLLRLVDPSTQGLHVLVVAEENAFEESLQKALIRAE